LRILIVSLAPLFPSAVHGGSQRILTQIAIGLAEAGNRVRIACGERPENRGGFELARNVSVEPVLKLGPFPAPYEIPPHLVAESASELRNRLEWADRLYLHADIFHFRPLLPAGLPVIRSFHDFHYETALVSAFAYPADLTIVPSVYLKRVIEATVGSSRTLEPIQVIPNGIDLTRYVPTGGSPPRSVRPRRGNELVLLHPHRPDARKGIRQALEILADVTARGPARTVRLLVPRHIDAASSPEVRAYYEGVASMALERGVARAVEYVDWLPAESMPELYSFADVTLCPGNFIESFGLTAYESLACGTPCVAATVGAFRDFPEAADFHRFEYGDTRRAADAVIEAASGMRDPDGARRMLAARFDAAAMVQGYVRAITGELPPAEPASHGSRHRKRATGRLGLAPWCHIAGARIYNDYAYRHLNLPEVARALGKQPAWSEADLVAAASRQEVDEAILTGTLIPTAGAAA